MLAIYGNQNNYLMVLHPSIHRPPTYAVFNRFSQGIGKLYSQLIFYCIFVVASLLALLWGAVVPCFRKVRKCGSADASPAHIFAAHPLVFSCGSPCDI